MSAKNQQVELDRAKADAFARRFLTTLNDGALCLMASVGHRTGLFDVMSQSPPSTSEELAARAGLNERYVREWLGAMVTARVVTFDPATSRLTREYLQRAGFRSITTHRLSHDIQNNWYVVSR
jgi:hypothetical protein